MGDEPRESVVHASFLKWALRGEPIVLAAGIAERDSDGFGPGSLIREIRFRDILFPWGKCYLRAHHKVIHVDLLGLQQRPPTDAAFASLPEVDADGPNGASPDARVPAPIDGIVDSPGAIGIPRKNGRTKPLSARPHMNQEVIGDHIGSRRCLDSDAIAKDTAEQVPLDPVSIVLPVEPDARPAAGSQPRTSPQCRDG